MNYKWFVGIDISKKTLDAVLYVKDSTQKSPHIQISNNNSGYIKLVKWLEKQKVTINFTLFCMEHTGIYGVKLANFLYEKSSCCLESPLQIKRSLGLTRGKSDKIDALQIARFCYLYREELKLYKPTSDSIIALKSLINERERLIKIRTTDKIIIKELDSKENTNCIKRTKERVIILTKNICQIEEEIEEIIKKDPSIDVNYKLIKSVVGIGLVNAVIFIVFTNNFNSITDPRKYACYSGVAPFEFSSGTSIRGKTKVSKLANKKIKVNLTNGARSAIINDPELKIYYNRKKEEGKEHGTVMNAVKFKLINRVFATVKRGTPYVKLRQAG